MSYGVVKHTITLSFQTPSPSTEEVSWHASKQSQASDYSCNTPLAKTNSHLITPRMPSYPYEAAFARLGLRWTNAHFLNSCNLDSFLTFIKILSLKHPKMFLTCFRLAHDVVEDTLREIISSYQSAQEHPMAHVLVDAQDCLTRIVWCQNVLNLGVQMGHQIDLIGSEEIHVWNHMRRSMQFEWVYECFCRPKAHQYVIRHQFSVERGGQLKELRELDPSIGPLYRKTCNRCQGYFSFKRVAVPETTWLLRVMFQEVRWWHPEAYKLPYFLSFGQYCFKLGYITYKQEVIPGMWHQTSCHLIQDQWFHYDGVDHRGQLLKVHENLLPLNPFKPMNAIYYKLI